MDKKFIFLDGFMIPATDGFSKTLAPGILSGVGVFETMRAYKGVIFALDDHLKRLQQGLNLLGLDLSWSLTELKAYLVKTLEVNKLQSARLRLMVWQSGQKVKTSIAVFPYKSLPLKKYREGFSAVLSDIRRDEKKVHHEIKSVNYLPFLVAHRRAKMLGADEALLLNTKGMLVEGSKSNLFFISKGILVTPSLRCGCLRGITRQIILKVAGYLGISVDETEAVPDELFNADEAFLTNSLLEVMPLTVVQGRCIGRGQPGPITERLQQIYQQKVSNAIALG